MGLMYASSNINTTSATYPYIVPLSGFYRPTVPTGCPTWVSQDTTGELSVSEAGTYRVDVTVIAQYADRTDIPVAAMVQRYTSGDSQIAGTSLNNV